MRSALSTKRLWIVVPGLLVIAVAVGGRVWLHRVGAPRVSYQIGPGRLTLSITADVVPPYLGLDFPASKYIDDFIPLFEIPPAGEAADPDSERGRALVRYNTAVRGQNAYYQALKRKYEYANSHPGEPVSYDPPPPPLPPFPSP